MSIGILAGIFSGLGYIVYLISIFKDHTKPSKTTWWIWTPVAIVLYISADAAGAKETLWVAWSEVVGIICIATVSLRYGSTEKEVGENWCIVGAGISFCLLHVSPKTALMCALLTDTFALWPTIQKSKRKPEEEDLFAWTLTQIGNLLNLFAIKTFAFGEIAYPVGLFILDGIILYFLVNHWFNKWRDRRL